MRFLHIGPRRGPHIRFVRTLIENDAVNEHIFLERFGDRVQQRQAGKRAIGVLDRTIEVHRRLQLERADILQRTRLINPDLVIFHSMELSRLGVMGLYGTRQRMLAHRYGARPVRRGVIKRLAYSRISLWVVPDFRGKNALMAAGIEEPRIKVLRPPIQKVQQRPAAQARADLGVQPAETTLVVMEPTVEEIEVLTPVINNLASSDEGYQLIIADPAEEAAEQVISLAQPAGPRVTVVESKPEEMLINAADAVLELSWDRSESVRTEAVLAMGAKKEVIALDSGSSRETLGPDGIYVASTDPTQVIPALRGYAPDPARRQRLYARGEAQFGLNKVNDHADAYKELAPLRSDSRARPA